MKRSYEESHPWLKFRLDIETLDHETLLVRRGRRSGLYTIVAVHSTARGPSLGGCRMWTYGDSRAAVRDGMATLGPLASRVIGELSGLLE